MSKKVFIDKEREANKKFQELVEEVRSGKSQPEKFTSELDKIMTEDPDFLEPYLLLYDLSRQTEDGEHGEEVLNTAYEIALKLITDNKGNWPEKLEWVYLQNRHIIKTLLNKAISLWHHGENDEALNLFRKLLKSNPKDNIGARYYILAILKNMSFKEFENEFDEGGHYSTKIMDWFDSNLREFPEEFDWWVNLKEED